MAYLLVVRACIFWNLHSQGSPAVVLVPAWEGYVRDVLAEPLGNRALRLVVAEQGENHVEIR